MTAIKPPWKTLRVSHFPTARRRLESSRTEATVSTRLLETTHLSYIHRKSARQSGTNRTTQAEISNLFWLSFPGQVNYARNSSYQWMRNPGAGQLHIPDCEQGKA